MKIINWGIGLYILIYPMVPSQEDINPLKVAMFSLTVSLLFVWMIQKIIRRAKFFSKSEYTYLYLFFLFLCISPILGIFNDFNIFDWARDIAPLLNLLLLPVLVDSIGEKRNGWLVYLAFIPAGLGIIRDILFLLLKYGLPIPESLFIVPLASVHASFGLGLGLIMFMHKSPYRKYWFALAVMSLVLAFLTPTRTAWITTGTMVILVTLFTTKRHILIAALILGLVAALSWLVFYGPGSSSYREAQSERVELLVNYQDDLSAQSRLDELSQTADLFLSAPLIGVGFGYTYNFFRSYVEGIVGAGYISTNYTHNDIMFIASKGGIIGLTLFGLMLYRLSYRLYRISKGNPASLQAAWARCGLLVIINSLVIGSSTPVYQTRSSMFFIVILLAMGLGYQKKDSGSAKNNIGPSWGLQPPGGGMPHGLRKSGGRIFDNQH